MIAPRAGSGDALARAERLGHRFEALAPSLGRAPIQRVKWKWSASSRGWLPVGSSSSTSVAPTHSGTRDGEEYDDEYRQATDPTVRPFLTGGRSFMGESGALLQEKGKNPSSSDIRETAVKTPNLSGGSGLHELLPTNMAPEVAKSDNPVAIGLQSGARTSTAHQMFRIEGGDVGGHTGFALKPTGGRGSTHTRGQGPAHDRMREAARSSVLKEKDADQAINSLMLKHLDVSPTGKDILSSTYAEGMKPSISSIGTVGPVNKKDPGRIRLAKLADQEREPVKKRLRAHKEQTGRGRSPSPERAPIDDEGEGGDYLVGPTLPPPPIPTFGGKSGSWQNVANKASWLTAPQREGFDFSSPMFSLPISTPTPSTSTSSPISPSIPTPTPSPTLTTSISSPTQISTPTLFPPFPSLPPTPSPFSPFPLSTPMSTPFSPPPLFSPSPSISMSTSHPFSTPTPPTPTVNPFAIPPSTTPSNRSGGYNLRKRKPKKY